MMNLDNLPTELLLQIFRYLDIHHLCKLKQTCKRFKAIITTWESQLIVNKKPLVSNQAHPAIIQRSAKIHPPIERIRISKNWQRGLYREKSLLDCGEKYIPWLQLTDSLFWLSRESHVRAYKRTPQGINTKKTFYSLKGRSKAEVCRFKLKNGLLVSGQRDGSLWLWSEYNEQFIFDMNCCHNRDIYSVDLCKDVIVSGSGDEYVKIWRNPYENTMNLKERVECLFLKDRVLSVALSDQPYLAIGTAGIEHLSTLTIFDITRKQNVAKYDSYSSSQGILDLKWENCHILWSCGYDGYLCKWDLRSGCVVQSFMDPCACSLYCFEHDCTNTILSGTSNNGGVVLWDTRKKNYVQMYFVRTCKKRNIRSPVYSLSFDAQFLFTATDKYVNILDFSVYNGKIHDYSNLSFLYA